MQLGCGMGERTTELGMHKFRTALDAAADGSQHALRSRKRADRAHCSLLLSLSELRAVLQAGRRARASGSGSGTTTWGNTKIYSVNFGRSKQVSDLGRVLSKRVCR